MELSAGIQASLSGRYASALFELASEAGSVSAVEGDLENLATALHESPELRALITEADPGAASGSDKAMLRITAETDIFWRSGERADRGDLRLGTVVSAWVAGPVRESYPVQADAATLVIEYTTRPAAPQA